MTFSRAKTPNWALGEKVTSTQLNKLDDDHVNSVDKTGDTITGTVAIGASGKVLSSTAGSVIQAAGSGKMELTGNATFEQTSGTSEMKLYKEPSYVPVMNTKVRYPLLAPGGLAGWTIGDYNQFIADTSGNTWRFLPIGFLPDKATIEAVSVGVTMAAGHAGVPTLQPRVQVYRLEPISGTTTLIGQATLAAPNAAAYQAITSIDVDCSASPNKTIDKGQYIYFVTIRAENGPNSITGAIYKDAQFTFNVVKLGGY